MNEAVLKITQICLEHLSDAELDSMYMQLVLCPESDPRGMPYYSRVSSLFQEEWDPPKIHDETKTAFEAVAASRLSFQQLIA